MWYGEPRWQHRLLAEQTLMSVRFPGFQLIREATGELAWLGQLRPTGGTEYVVSITYPQRYPYLEPKLRILHPQVLPGAPHTYFDSSLCVHRTAWHPDRSTAVSEVPLIAAWLVAYENWLRSGESF